MTPEERAEQYLKQILPNLTKSLVSIYSELDRPFHRGELFRFTYGYQGVKSEVLELINELDNPEEVEYTN